VGSWRARLAGSAVIIAVAGVVLRDLFLEELMYAISDKVVTFGSGQEPFMFATRAMPSVLECGTEIEISSSTMDQIVANALSGPSTLDQVLSEPPTLDQVLSQRACGGVKIVVFDAAQLPFVTQNITDAWWAADPEVLTSDSGAESANRGEACPETFVRRHGGACSAYPFASTTEGGREARAREVPPREGRCEAATLRAQTAAAGIRDGESYIVVITHPDQIASDPYQGIDIAYDQSCG